MYLLSFRFLNLTFHLYSIILYIVNYLNHKPFSPHQFLEQQESAENIVSIRSTNRKGIL